MDGDDWKSTGRDAAHDDIARHGAPCATLDEVIALPTPVACRGAQGLWTVPADALAQVIEQERGVAAQKETTR